ncbi:MAG: hypothetical protein GY801_03555, partial [bacterium]|nr:hypothetical protein [bacterium]
PVGDVRWLNNVLFGWCNLNAYDQATLPVNMAGNVFLKGSKPGRHETAPLLRQDFDPGIAIVEKADGWYLEFTFDSDWKSVVSRNLVTSEVLGRAQVPDVPFENRDGSPINLDSDYFGEARNPQNPFPGPFEITGTGKQSLKVYHTAGKRGKVIKVCDNQRDEYLQRCSKVQKYLDKSVVQELRGILKDNDVLLEKLDEYEESFGQIADGLKTESADALRKAEEFAEFVQQPYRSLLDRPLLFIKRYSYKGIHIYDTFYKWPAGYAGNGQGIGGIYILENPWASRDQWNIRTVIDGTTEGGLGNGVYSHPDISYDCSKIIFCYKATANGSTMIYEIDIDGSNLRRLTDPTSCLAEYKGRKHGIHDISPTYMPDGRIVFLSTRPAGLVPCANEGVSVLHVMNADGSDIHPISVNSETEFDPMVLPDGRIIYGRWEYIDKTALTVQSLWTVNPDGSNETAMYGNNMVFPEAILDPRPVLGTGLIAVTLAKHNASPRGAIAMIDPTVGKNDPAAIFNFENKTNPTYDLGNSCEPYPLSKDVVIYSGRAKGARHNSITMMNRNGWQITLLSDPKISLHAPMLVKPRSSRQMPQFVDRTKKTGNLYVQNVYDGLKGVKPGEAKWLRIIEESSRVSASPDGTPYNQTFSISAALAFSAKIYHGMVPIHEDGSVYFEVPSGRAIFFQVLDKDKRLLQSMRTFIQAAPGTTRSCIGCHEKKTNAPTSLKPISNTLAIR